MVIGLCYFLLISTAAVILCIHDKLTAVKNGQRDKKLRRIPEKTLFIISALGGSIAMLSTMLIIRHKTQHKRFMIGLPLIIVAQIALAIAVKLLITSFFPVA